jgi:hypothetical protein
VSLTIARAQWPRAYEVAGHALGIHPVHATTAVMDERLILCLWGPTFAHPDGEGEIAGMAAITAPLTAAELADLMQAREAWH